MPKALDLTGQRFGRLTVIEKTDKRNNGGNVWKCLCECGNIVEVRSDCLRCGHTQSCGCLRKEKAKEIGKKTIIDLIGQRFGKLIVIEKTDKRSGNREIIWKCRCDCGNITEASSYLLRNGQTQSCGCLQKEKIKEIGKKRFVDLTGQKFGRLTAIEKTDKRSGSSVIWKCRCDCGAITEVSSANLQSDHTQSCGCLKISHGELKIQELLKENNISFIAEYCPKDLSFQGRFDFAIMDNNFPVYFIEFDGIQHFQYNSSGWDTKEHFQTTRERDVLKNNYCYEHGIPLIRIPYTHLNNLTYEDLDITTSKFIMTKEREEQYYV